MSKFKIGDKVKITELIGFDRDLGVREGYVYQIEYIDSDGDITVILKGGTIRCLLKKQFALYSPALRSVKEIVNDIKELTAELYDAEQILSSPKSVWDLQGEQKCWAISGKGAVLPYNASMKGFEARRAAGNMFLTEQEARGSLTNRKTFARKSAQGIALINSETCPREL